LICYADGFDVGEGIALRGELGTGFVYAGRNGGDEVVGVVFVPTKCEGVLLAEESRQVADHVRAIGGSP
jgi:hypothetical protein